MRARHSRVKQESQRRIDLYGRGACDVKRPMAAMLIGIGQYLDAPGDPPGTLYFAAPCEEEVSGMGSAALAASTTFRPDAVIVAEPTDFNVVYRHKGVVRYRITTHGRAVHSSDPTRGVNAIGRMQCVLEMLASHSAWLQAEPGDAELGHGSLSVGTIQGGTQENIVPDHCTIEVDHRILPGVSPEDAARPLREAMATWPEDPAAAVRPTQPDVDLAFPGLGLCADAPIVCTVIAAVRGVVPRASATVAHYATDAGFYHAAGIPAIVFGPGSIHQAHTKDEWIHTEALVQGATAYARIIEACFAPSCSRTAAGESPAQTACS